MLGGISVVGCVTGTHIIADIGIAVPHKIAVHIPAELLLRSKDLHVALQQGRIMKLDGGSALRVDNKPSHKSEAALIARLEAENKKLRRELQEAQNREAGLHQVLTSLGGQLSGIQGALGRLETRQPVIQQVLATPGGLAANVEASEFEVVGGAAPTFMPEQIAPTNAETSIQVKHEEASQSNVSDARNKLREMRKKS